MGCKQSKKSYSETSSSGTENLRKTVRSSGRINRDSSTQYSPPTNLDFSSASEWASISEESSSTESRWEIVSQDSIQQESEESSSTESRWESYVSYSGWDGRTRYLLENPPRRGEQTY